MTCHCSSWKSLFNAFEKIYVWHFMVTAKWRPFNSAFLCGRYTFVSACMLAVLAYLRPHGNWPNEGRWSRFRTPACATQSPQPTHTCNIKVLAGAKVGNVTKKRTTVKIMLRYIDVWLDLSLQVCQCLAF